MTSFLAIMKQRLSQASVLISACGQAKVSVDASIAALEDTLGRFRVAIAAVGEAVVDITLIGMNAGLKAGHLGEKGRAFVVIANELQLTADRISGVAKMLAPVLDHIGQAADRLKSLRVEEESLKVADLEGSIIRAVEEVEAGNGQLGRLMSHLTRESVQFESLMTGARAAMFGLGGKFAVLPGVAGRLQAPNRDVKMLSPREAHDVGELFDELHLQYTMQTEREVHLEHCDRFGIERKLSIAGPATHKTEPEDVLFF